LSVVQEDDLERRLADLAFDVHDGPLQDLAALRFDLHLFRRQLAESLRDPADQAPRLLGRVDDLTARLEAAEDELRRLAALAGSRGFLAGGFEDALRSIVDEQAHRCHVTIVIGETLLERPLRDDVRVAALRVVQAAVANVARHSGAHYAEVRARLEDHALVVDVIDAGNGFDVEDVLRTAAASGRLGVLGMRERVAGLGGTLRIESETGVGTRVSLRLPLP
jgi:signal transduction histidine kinase